MLVALLVDPVHTAFADLKASKDDDAALLVPFKGPIVVWVT